VPNIINIDVWYSGTSGAYRDFNGIATNCNLYGRLYTWYVTSDARKICSTGCHIASENEWKVLNTYVVGCSLACNRIKATGTQHWPVPNSDASNSSGFTTLSFGFLNDYFEFIDLFYRAAWCISTECQYDIYYGLRWSITSAITSLS
jgi:uncharacterized protein (TIGR02145 family)